jgi:hypothetical protein
MHSSLPWNTLGRFVSPDEERPGFFRNYLKLWFGGVRPAPPIQAPLQSRAGQVTPEAT